MLHWVLGIQLVILLLVFLGVSNPLIDWRSYGVAWRVAIRDKRLSRRSQVRMISYLMRDLLLSPLHSVLWLVDEVAFGRALNNLSLDPPVFIVSQPRSGTTLLHRMLAQDTNNFFAATYLEYKWPYLCVWKLIDVLGLRQRLNRRNYWPDSAEGSEASRMHPHVYGDYEEHGIFLEEKFYHHYFVFRRFPNKDILRLNTNYEALDEDQIDHIIFTLDRTIRKIAYYSGYSQGQSWLTKENESVSFYRKMVEFYPDAKLIFLVRNHEDMLSSYFSLSRASTKAKTGIDILDRQELWWANLEFRKMECERFCHFYDDVSSRGKSTVLVNYDVLIRDIPGTVVKIYDSLGLEANSSFRFLLEYFGKRQNNHVRMYSVTRLLQEDRTGFENFAELVAKSEREE